MVLGSISIFIGSMFCSQNVATTLSSEIIPGTEDLEKKLQDVMMFSVCATSFLFLLGSSLFAMPVSGTHTVIGALLGAGLVTLGVDGPNWQKLIKIVASWFISPATAGVLASLIGYSILLLTCNTNMSYSLRIHM